MMLAFRMSVSSAFLATMSVAEPAVAQTRFAVIGDIGNSAGAASVADLVKGRSVHHVITTGDNCYGSVPIATQIGSNYKSFVDAGRFWPSLGNHDYTDACGNGGKAYLAYFDLPSNERYYEVRLGPVHFFAINSHAREPHGNRVNSKQARWLKRRIRASSAPWQVVFFHHPPYSSGEHGSTRYMRWPFEEWGVDAVFNGHDHNYERIVRDDNRNGKMLPYFVSGLGGRGTDPIPGDVDGSAFKYSSAFGALFIDATEQQLKFEFRNVSGQVVDTYAVTK